MVIPTSSWIRRYLVPELGTDLGVKRRQGFVKQQQTGLCAQRPGQRDPLLLAAGKLVWVPFRQWGQAHQVEQFACTLAPFGSGDPAHLQPETNVLQGVHVGEQAVRLEHHAQVATMSWHVGDVVTTDQHRTLVEPLEPGQCPQGRRLATPGRPQQGHQLARSDGDRETRPARAPCRRCDGS